MTKHQLAFSEVLQLKYGYIKSVELQLKNFGDVITKIFYINRRKMPVESSLKNIRKFITKKLI